MSLRDAAQELVELGPRGTLFRVAWELKGRAGFTSARTGQSTDVPQAEEWTHRLQLEDPITLARGLRDRIGPTALASLNGMAQGATTGRIVCFGRWTADFGMPIDWHGAPGTGRKWTADAPWFRALADQGAGDVKYSWEAARFPHAYHLARAATFSPDRAEAYAAALLEQIEGFVGANPRGLGIHWASGQEIGFRLLAWLFAVHVLLSRTAAGRRGETVVADALLMGARHIEDHLDYARIAVYNNHLLSEALALFGVGALLPGTAESVRWRDIGRRILDQEAGRQFYEDGGYIQQAHNYHRVALQNYLWACTFARAFGDAPSAVWIRALERSLTFLVGHQNPADGRLPNYGSNDGALPSILSTCDFSDMRPTLQAVSILVRGERLYEPGPWDEEAAWFFGVRSLDAPLRKAERRSVSFAHTGYHVLRGRDESNFGAFRCGTLRDRFSQIDMLHLDVWWRGENVLVDPGSYQYNAAPRWHDHFVRTAAHNTLVVDDRDQMVHHRQFKVLYWTKAALHRFGDTPDWAVCAGEHYGYRRYPGACIHRREVLFVKDDLWVVVDRVTGEGEHAVRLHWLGGPFEWAAADESNGMDLRTPAGVFAVRAFQSDGQPFAGDVVAGDEGTPRGWLSRYYGEKVPAPSFAATYQGRVPVVLVSVLSGVPFDLAVKGANWTITTPGGGASFALQDGSIKSVEIAH